MTRKYTRWKRGEFVVAEKVRKQSESEDGGMRELKERYWSLLRLEKAPEGRFDNLFFSRSRTKENVKKEGG